MATSRARTLNNLHIIRLRAQSIYCKAECVLEYNKLIRKYYPGTDTIKTFNVLPSKYATIITKNEKKISKKFLANHEKPKITEKKPSIK